jgi:hypothetical protein
MDSVSTCPRCTRAAMKDTAFCAYCGTPLYGVAATRVKRSRVSRRGLFTATIFVLFILWGLHRAFNAPNIPPSSATTSPKVVQPIKPSATIAQNSDTYLSAGVPFRRVGDAWIRNDYDYCRGSDWQEIGNQKSGGMEFASYAEVCRLTGDHADQADAWWYRKHPDLAVAAKRQKEKDELVSQENSAKLATASEPKEESQFMFKRTFVQTFEALTDVDESTLNVIANEEYDRCKSVGMLAHMSDCIDHMPYQYASYLNSHRK